VKKTTPNTLLAFCSLATVAALDMLGVDDDTMEPDRRGVVVVVLLVLLILRPRLDDVVLLAEALTMRMGWPSSTAV
jgi:hypothetical protein